jgi:cysteine desulfurase
MASIYMDHHATTPVDPRVLAAMLPYFGEKFGNAGSRIHSYGKEAARAVDRAREQVASLIGADPSEIVFTSGATESDNLALQGVAELHRGKGGHLVSQATEHKAVLDVLRALEAAGRARATILPVGKDGLLDPGAFRDALTGKTVLASVMAANNEIGVIQPVAEFGKACRERGVLFHSDAAQACGRIPVDVDEWHVDLLSLSAHKMYGPKGVGALFVRKRNPRVRLSPLLHGGGQELGLRPGTLPVPLIVGFGEACEIARRELPAESARLLDLRKRLHSRIFSDLEHVHVNGSLASRLPGNLNVSFEYVEGESLILGMGEVALSSGSACTTATLEPSHVLAALGVPEPLARASLRFGLGRGNTQAEVDRVADLLRREVGRLRELSPLYPLASKGRNG